MIYEINHERGSTYWFLKGYTIMGKHHESGPTYWYKGYIITGKQYFPNSESPCIGEITRSANDVTRTVPVNCR